MPCARRARVGVGVEVGDEDGVLEGRHLGLESRDDVHAVERLAAVRVAVDGEEDLGLDLGEAVDDRAGAEVGRAGRPDGADRGGGEKADRPPRGSSGGRRRRDLRARPRASAGRRRMSPTRCSSSPQVISARSRALRLVLDGELRLVLAAEDVLGVVEAGAGEPLRAGHVRACRERSRRRRRPRLRSSPRSSARRSSTSATDQSQRRP